MSILFINASPNHDGNTAHLAEELLGNHPYTQLDLIDYKIYGYGQTFDDDQIGEVLAAIHNADTIVIGSPMYWHNITGLLRNLLDSCYGRIESGSLAGRTLYFLFQGAAPEKWMLNAGDYTMKRFAGLYGMTYGGMATNTSEARELGRSINR